MSVETYAYAWSQLSDQGRVELTDLAHGDGSAAVSDDLRSELLALKPDSIEWRPWQPASVSQHQTTVDARLLAWVRAQAPRSS
jgi:hypothetical protein